MARELFWRRNMNISFNWIDGTQGNEHMFYVNEGETLMRLIVHVRIWARPADQTAVGTDSMIVPQAFGLLYADGTFTNPTLRYPISDADDLPDKWLWVERYNMRDAHTPAGYSAVNLAWQDERVNQTLNTRARRLGRQVAPAADEVLFAWQGFSTILADPLVVSPQVGFSALFLGPETL